MSVLVIVRMVSANDGFAANRAFGAVSPYDSLWWPSTGGVFRGRDEIHRIAGVIKATHPDFQYQPIAPPEETGDSGRVRWVSGVPGQPPAYAGTDFIIARDGKIVAVYLFFNELP
jgi:hypothetical protein